MSEEFKHFERPTTSKPGTLISATIVSALVGLVTGAAGFTLMRELYPQDVVVLPQDGPVQPVILDESIVGSVPAIGSRLAAIYAAGVNTGDAYSQLYTDAQYLASGAIVTSDGWIMVAPKAAIDSSLSYIISVNGKLYRSQEIVRDSKLSLWLIKIDASNLQPVEFDTDLALGTKLVYSRAQIGNQPLFAGTSLSQKAKLDTSSRLAQVQFSDSFSIYDIASSELEDASAILFTTEGKVAGVTTGSGRALLTARALEASLRHLLQKQNYVSLGIYYIDLYRASLDEKGVLITHPNKQAVVYNSVAAKAGLKTNDTIIKINGQAISYSNPLALIMLDLKTGDEATLSIIRGGVEQEVLVKF